MSNNAEKQQDHLERMKHDQEVNKDYYDRIMAIRYPVYMDLIASYKKPGKLLDIGAGFADVWLKEYVQPAGYTYYCTDISDEVVSYMAERLAGQGSGPYAKIGTLENLPWEPGSFDVVYASHILEHTTDIRKAFDEIARVLKPEGVLLFAVPCGNDDEPAHVHNRELEEWQTDFADNHWKVLASGQFEFNNNEFYGLAAPVRAAGAKTGSGERGWLASVASHAKGIFLKRPPTLQKISSQLCTASQFREAAYDFWLNEIGQVRKFHRKQWEYVYILQALQQHDLLREGVKGVGFGCGKEPLPAVMAKYGCEVLATDIGPREGGDAHWGATAAGDIFYPGICSKETFMARVSFRNLDMNRISGDLTGGYDFVWSCCALEHLGSLQAGIDFIITSSHCLKPGGVAVHTTELNLGNGSDTLETPGLSLYRKQDMQALARLLRKHGCRMLPCNWDSGDQPEDRYVDLPPYKEDIHLKLRIEEYVITSLGIVVIRD